MKKMEIWLRFGADLYSGEDRMLYRNQVRFSKLKYECAKSRQNKCSACTNAPYFDFGKDDAQSCAYNNKLP